MSERWLLLVMVGTVAVMAPILALWARLWKPKIIDRITPTPSVTESFARIVRLSRRDGETLSAFEARVLAAHRELDAASTEFMNAAEQLGHFEAASETYRSEAEVINAVEHHGSVVWHRLPPDHPAAVRYALAKKGDWD